MKTYTTSEIEAYEYIVDFAQALPSGHGHKEITVIIKSKDGHTKDFKSVTSNMYDYDNAMDLEGQERYEALFELVENNLNGRIAEWLFTSEDN